MGDRSPAEGVVRIEVPTPYEVGPVNVYVILGQRPTLVDVGPRTEAAAEVLRRGLNDIGLGWRDIEQIVITHTHVDHHGLLEWVLERAPRATVVAHRLAQIGFGRQLDRRLAFYDELFARSGMPSPLRHQVAQGLKHMLELEPKVSVNRWLQDGDLVQAGDGTWRVVHAPGHASNLIGLYREATQTFIGSDHLLAQVSSNAIVEPPPEGAEGRSHSLIQYIDALRKVALLPVRVVLPGHGEPFGDVAGLVEQRLHMHERRLQDIETRLGGLGEGPGRPGTHGLDATAAGFAREGATVFQLAASMFQPRDGDTLTLAMSEVLGHLDILVARERVVLEERQGLYVYRPRR